MTEQKKKILIVDDEMPMVRALELKLSHSGFDVKSALDGEAALKMLAAEKFDLILLDLIMPKKDGFAVLSEMKEKNITTPVFILSNLGQNEDVKKAKELGARDYLIKSNTPILEIVKQVTKSIQKWS